MISLVSNLFSVVVTILQRLAELQEQVLATSPPSCNGRLDGINEDGPNQQDFFASPRRPSLPESKVLVLYTGGRWKILRRAH